MSNRPFHDHWTVFLAHLLFVLAAWTVFIKYLFPMGFALAAGQPVTSNVYWDLWPLTRAWLGWALLARPRYTRVLAIGMSLVEIAIIVTLLAQFLSNPEWTIWRSNWFVNKVFVLAAFVMILTTAVASPDRVAGKTARGAGHSASDEGDNP